MITLLLMIGAYLIGSISFAVIVSKGLGLADPRTYGSQNPGATNVLRSGSKRAAALTLLGDSLKGWLAVWITQILGAMQYNVALVAIAVFIGHLWPVFFRFKGGKGVATALGILLAFNIWLGLAALATWLVVAYLLHYSSLAALAAALLTPFYYGLLSSRLDSILLAVLVISSLLIWRHKQNIANLRTGKENKI